MRLTRTTTVGAVAALALVPASALALTTEGSDRGERLRGTAGPDQIDGRGGADRIFGFQADDLLVGGFGADRVFGGLGDDELRGAQDNDRLHGGGGNDRVVGDAPNAGDRTSFDRLFGGAGNDTVRSVGGSRDVIDCGPGRDRVVKDSRDVVRGCEVVLRP